MLRRTTLAVCAGFALLLVGCGSSQLDPIPAFQDVQAEVAERSGAQLVWRESEQREADVAREVDRLLADGLTLDEAVRLTLLANRRLQATYERLGVAQARVVQAGLLRNPMFDASLRFVEGSGSGYILEMGAVQDILDVFLIPLRKRLSKAQLQVTKSEVVGAVLDVTADVATAFVALQAAQQTLDLNEQLLQATDASYDAAQRLHQAGNITDLALANERALYEQARLAVASAETTVLERRETLNALMGLWGDRTDWQVQSRLPAIPEQALDLSDLERRVVAHSLDLQIVRERMIATAARMGIDTSELVFPDLAAGAEAEREPDGTWSVGPAVGIGIPLFDQGVARKAAGRAELRRLWDEYTALAIELRAAARAARHRLRNARRQSAYYDRVVVPLAEQITAETQLRYNAMQLGVFQLLAAKQREIDTRRRAIATLENYWIARAELELLLDGRMIGPMATRVSVGETMAMPAREGGH